MRQIQQKTIKVKIGGAFMAEKPNYIQWIMGKVGHELIFLNFAGGIVCNERNEVLLQRRGDNNAWGFPGGAMELGSPLR